jgi:hypothetical protein
MELVNGTFGAVDNGYRSPPLRRIFALFAAKCHRN